jgi:hypothetical protein
MTFVSQASRLILALLLPPLIAIAYAPLDRRVVMPPVFDLLAATLPTVTGAIILLKMPWRPLVKACAAIAYATVMISMVTVVALMNAFP